jgi:hypothetical protein
MKKLIFTLVSVLIFFCAQSQDAETEIRKLENEAKDAILKKDSVAFSKLFAPGFVINSPANRVETFQDLLVRMRSGGIDRSTFEKNIEKITFAENMAIVMGNEIVVPKGRAANAGMTTKRRYTNVWVKTNDRWQLVARQSTIISME